MLFNKNTDQILISSAVAFLFDEGDLGAELFEDPLKEYRIECGDYGDSHEDQKAHGEGRELPQSICEAARDNYIHDGYGDVGYREQQ